MYKIFDTVYAANLKSDVEKLRNRPYGMIEVVEGRLVGIQLRPWPKFISGIEAKWADGWGKSRDKKNQSQVFYSQPMAHRNYLTLSYAVTTLQTSWTTLSYSLALLDYIAYLKKSDAILTEVSNVRISNRLMERLGYEQHLLASKKRHYIKRFYGTYPDNRMLVKKLDLKFNSKLAIGA